MALIARVFFDCDLRCAFDGLHSLMRKSGMKPELTTDFVIFFNRSRTKFKLISGSYLAYYSNGDRKIPLTAIQYLPAAFGGDEMNLERAMTKAMRKDIAKKLNVSLE